MSDDEKVHVQTDYVRLRDQCLSAMSELETLRCGHAEILNRCEMATQEAEYYRQENAEITGKSEQSSKDFEELMIKFKQVNSDRNKLRQDYEEIVLLREQEKLELSKSTNQTKDDGKQKHDDEFKLEDLRADYDLLAIKYKQLEEENLKAHEQYGTINKSREALVVERNALKQQCTTAICGYEKALRDRDDAVHECLQHKQLCNSAVLELEQAVKVKLQMSKDIIKLREERNSALQEYKLVMSERDSVHQEIEKLQHDLGITKEEAKKLIDDKEKVYLEKEGLRHEIIAVLADRDKAVKEVHDLRSRLQITMKEKESSVKQLEDQRQDYEMLKQERNAAKKERSEAIVHRDRILKECFEVKRLFAMIAAGDDQTEGLKKPFDKLSNELTKAWNIAEVSMTRRDWAFSERDKVVRELEDYKEKYKQCCLEKSSVEEELQFYKSECSMLKKRFEDLSQQMQLRKSIVFDDKNEENLRSSQDSAIDTDAPSYHIETVELERASENEDFGFNIGGGKDAPLSPHDTSVFVIKVDETLSAAKKLKVNDCILCINNIDMTNADSQTAFDVITATNFLNITILRHTRAGAKTPLQRVEIKSSNEQSIGLSVDSGLHIKRIEPGSAAAKEETLSIGDKILSVNGYSMDKVPFREAISFLKTSRLSLTVLKSSVSSTSSHHSLPQNNDDEKHIVEKRFNHFRSPSAPVCVAVNHTFEHQNHLRSHSVVSRSSDEEIENIFSEFRDKSSRVSEAKKRKHLEKRSDELLKRRTFMSSSHPDTDALKRQGNLFSPEQSLLPRPMSAQDSKISVTSNNSRYLYENRTPSSPLNINRSDPLALSPRTIGLSDPLTLSPRTTGHTSSTATSNASVNSVSRSAHKKRRPFTVTSRYIPHSSLQDTSRKSHQVHRTLSEIFSNNSSSLHQYLHTCPPASNSEASQHYGTFPGKQTRFICEQTHGSKTGSSRSFGYKSCSSYGSINSSECSDKMVSTNLGNIEPVHEETLESLQEFSKNDFSDLRNSSHSYKPSKSPLQKRSKVPSVGSEPRETVIEKGQYPLGITIAQGKNNGIFVTGVNKESIASKVGLKYGDQLLEYNGINLRMASYEQAALILKQSAVESTVTVLAQYNPSKMHEASEKTPSTSTTPRTSRRTLVSTFTSPSLSKRLSLSPNKRLHSNSSTCSDQTHFTPIAEDDTVEEPRLIRIIRDPASTPLGIGIIGGNAIGIYVSDIKKESLVETQAGLKCGDQILEYNAKPMRSSSLEEATLELGKPTEVADFHVQYNPPGYLQAQAGPGDSFYIRTMYDRQPTQKGELAFKRGNILLVTSTLYKGQLGVWRASLLPEYNDDMNKRTSGRIPSRGKAEQELLLRKSSAYGDDKSKVRKSLFRRSKKSSHGCSVNHSRESSDSKVDIDVPLSTSFQVIPNCDVGAYQYVKRYDTTFLRPVVVIGAMVEPICDKLVVESAATFSRCLPEISDLSKSIMDTRTSEGCYIDYKRSHKGDRYECITPESVKDVVYGKTKHCLLDINVEAIERLSPLKLYPIVIFVKHKSAKHIKDLKDGHYIRDKISSKSAKDMFDNYVKVEKDYSRIFTVVTNNQSLQGICREINDYVVEQQQMVLWITDH